MKFQFTNRASAHLASPLAADNTQLSLAPGTGDRFPAVTSDTPAQLSLTAVNGAQEIVQCWSRAGDVMQVLRGQEGTAVSAFATGSLVELRVTAAVLNSFLPLGGGTMTGTLQMGGRTIDNAVLTGAPTIDYIKTNGVYPLDANFATSIQFLNGGILPRINGNSILTTVMLHSAVFLWWGRADQLPPWLKICDGTLGTPDMRDRFPLGANNDSDIGSWGGQFHWRTFGIGQHFHGGATTLTALGSFNLPSLLPPSLNVTKLKIANSSLGSAHTNEPATDFVTNVTMSGGGGYSGAPSHAHGLTGDGAHDHEFDAVPPFFRLYYVMFRSMQIN